MIWIILSIAAVGLCLLLALHLADKDEKNSVGEKIVDKENMLSFAGHIFNQEKVVIKFNNDIYEHCIQRKNFVYCYDAYGKFEQVLVKDNDKCFEIFCMFPTDAYIYKSGSWDLF